MFRLPDNLLRKHANHGANQNALDIRLEAILRASFSYLKHGDVYLNMVGEDSTKVQDTRFN